MLDQAPCQGLELPNGINGLGASGGFFGSRRRARAASIAGSLASGVAWAVRRGAVGPPFALWCAAQAFGTIAVLPSICRR